MDENEINDIRKQTDFKGITFSKYKKTEVKKALLESLLNSKIENAIHWSAEYICSGHFMDLWEIILLFMSKYVHLGNPRLPIYIDMRFDNFKEIVANGYIDNEIRMRNNEKVRKLFAEIICILCFSNKKHSTEAIKIKKEEFDITGMTFRLKAPNIEYIKTVFQKDDPKELYIALNEFAYHISKDSKNSLLACYWIEWIMEFEKICKAKKEKCIAQRRVFPPVQDKEQFDVIWIVWEILLKETENHSTFIKKIVNSNLNLFSLRYTNGVKKKRRYLLYFTVALLTETVDLKQDIISNSTNKSAINKIVDRINIIYKNIKKNEDKPATDYLFNNGLAGRSNLEKTVEKLDKMNDLSNLVFRKDEDLE